jgi:hypothetical protein
MFRLNDVILSMFGPIQLQDKHDVRDYNLRDLATAGPKCAFICYGYPTVRARG